MPNKTSDIWISFFLENWRGIRSETTHMIAENQKYLAVIKPCHK
jgi:hypothetical protein